MRIEILHTIYEGETEKSMANRLSAAFDNEEIFVIQIASTP